MEIPPKDEDKGYWHLDPLDLVAGRLAYEDHVKEMTTWSRADFMTRKFENAPKDGALDDAPPTWLKSSWGKLLKALHRRH